MRQPVLLDVQGAFADPTNEGLRSRHATYGVTVRELSNGRCEDLLVLSKSDVAIGEKIHQRVGLTVVSIGASTSYWALGKTAAQVASQLPQQVTWIAGTPFYESIACFAAHRHRPGKFQIQVHGNFGILSPFRGSIKDRAKWLMARWSLPLADSVRAVSPEQLISLISRYRLDSSKCFVAPVPISNSASKTESPPSRLSSPLKIGFVGRLHNERGLKLWSQTAHELSSLNKSLEFHIIGEGPHRQEFEQRLSKLQLSSKVFFHGHIPTSELSSHVSNLSLVLSTCGTEAYGRAVLEVLSLGVTVVALESSGTHFIEDVFSPQNLYLASEKDILTKTIRALSINPKPDTERLRSSIQRFERTSVETLVKSWI